MFPVGKRLLKVSKITLEQKPDGLCSSVIFLTLNMFLPVGRAVILFLGAISKNFQGESVVSMNVQLIGFFNCKIVDLTLFIVD